MKCTGVDEPTGIAHVHSHAEHFGKHQFGLPALSGLGYLQTLTTIGNSHSLSPGVKWDPPLAGTATDPTRFPFGFL